MAKIYKTERLPEGTMIKNNMSSIDYSDSYKIVKKNEDSIQKIAEKILSLPTWVNIALQIRFYLIVKPFGLSTGRFDDIEERPDASNEPVPIIEKNEHEIVMGSDDKHLYYRISVMKKQIGQETEIYLNTVVKFNNIWGRLYFIPVRLGHKCVVRSLLKRLI